MYGQLGTGIESCAEVISNEFKMAWTPSRNIIKQRIKWVGAYLNSSCALTVDGQVYFWGSNYEKSVQYFYPVKLPIRDVHKISPCKFIYILKCDGSVHKYDPFKDQLTQIRSDIQFSDMYTKTFDDKKEELILFQSDDCVYELRDNVFIKTHYRNFYDYCWQRFSITYKNNYSLK